jgi:hypothetical protein
VAKGNPGEESNLNLASAPAETYTRSYELTEEEMAVLVQASGQRVANGSPLSALRLRSDWHLQDAHRTLHQRAFLGDRGMEPRLECAIRALAAPDVEIVEIGGPLPLLAVSRQYVSVESQSSFVTAYSNDHPDRHRIRFPVPGGEIFPITRALLRECRASGIAPFAVSLSLKEYAAVMALIDFYRQAALPVLTERQRASKVLVTPARVAEVYRAGIQGKNRHCLVTLARDLSPVSLDLDPAEIPEVMAQLVQKGLLRPLDKQAWRFAPDLAVFCHSLSRAGGALGLVLVIGRRAASPHPIGITAFWATGFLWLFDFSSGQEGVDVNVRSVLAAELSLALRALYNTACDESLGMVALPRPGQSVPAPWPAIPLEDGERECPGCRVCRGRARGSGKASLQAARQ